MLAILYWVSHRIRYKLKQYKELRRAGQLGPVGSLVRDYCFVHPPCDKVILY